MSVITHLAIKWEKYHYVVGIGRYLVQHLLQTVHFISAYFSPVLRPLKPVWLLSFIYCFYETLKNIYEQKLRRHKNVKKKKCLTQSNCTIMR